MNSLVKELIQGLLPEEDENKKTVALFGDGVAIFGGGFKPPTKGHFEVVKTALDQNPEIDEFLILIGRGVRDGITQEDSFKIWNIYKNYLPSKVKIINSVKAPIGAIYEYAKKHPEEEVLWIIGAREGNESDFIDISSRTKSITKYPNLELRTIITNGGVSGTAARNAAKISPQKLNQFLPDFLSLQEKNTIFTILNNDISEKLNEIGDASASPYSYTIEVSDNIIYRYYFKTESEIEYEVIIEPYDRYGSLEEYYISFSTRGNEDEDWEVDIVHSKGELYKVMSTVVSIIKDFLKKNPEVTKLSYSPSSKDGEGAIDNQRARLYSAFITSQIKGINIKTDEEDKLITINIPKKFKKSLQDKEDVNEIGNASATPYPYKLENTGNLDYRYLFTTTSKIQYKVDIDALAPTLQHYSIAFASKSPEENQYWDYQAVHSKGELYKVMSTVVAIIKDFLKLNPEVTKLTFSPSSKDGEGGLDNQRAKLYTTFITSQIKDAHIEKSYRNKEFTIILPSNFTKDSQNKEEELNEIGDANAEPYIININAKKIKTQSFSFKTDPFKVKDENGKEKEVPGTEYEVYLFRNGYRSREKFQNKGESYELGFAAKSYKDLDYNYNVTNEGNMFRVMATIVKIIKFFLKENPQVVEISFQPSPKTGEDNLDNKRAKLYMAYITKHLPGNKVELNSNNNTIYIQVSKEKKINEIGDASAEPYNIRNDSNRMFFFKTDPITKKDENGNEEEIDGTDYIVIFRKNSFLSRNGNLSFELSFEAKSFNDGEFSFKTVNEGNMFRVMATIVKIVKHFIKATPEATEIFFSPYPKKGESKLDNKRAKLYMAYIAKHLPDGVEVTDVVSPDYGMNTLHIKLPKKEELTEVNYTKPKFGFEWEEAIRYPEFQEMGRREWIKKARSGYSTNYSKIKDVLGNVDLNFKNLERPKQKRFQSAFHQGNIEMPIVVKFSDNDYDLVAGNTRLSGLIKNGIDPEVWVVDISDLQENYADGKVLNENASYSQHIDIKQQIKELTQYMLDKGMNIKPLPKVIFKHGNTSNAKDFFGKTAYYNPNDKSIVLYTEGRHPKDIVRSFSHEMIHHIQNLEGRLGNITTTNTMEDDHLDKIEQEANLGGTTTFRNWTDSLNEISLPKATQQISKLNPEVDAKEVAKDFIRLSPNLDKKDLFQYKTYDELEQELKKASLSKSQRRKQAKSMDLEDNKFIFYKDDNFIIYKLDNPSQHPESCEIAQGAKICVASNSKKYWNQYMIDNDGVLFYIRNKKYDIPHPESIIAFMFPRKGLKIGYTEMVDYNDDDFIDHGNYKEQKEYLSSIGIPINVIEKMFKFIPDVKPLSYYIKNYQGKKKQFKIDGKTYFFYSPDTPPAIGNPKVFEDENGKVIGIIKGSVDKLSPIQKKWLKFRFPNFPDSSIYEITKVNRYWEENSKEVNLYNIKNNKLIKVGEAHLPYGPEQIKTFMSGNNVEVPDAFKDKIQKHIKEYKQYVLNELFEKDLPIINKTSKNTYIVSNGEDIDAEYYFRLEIPERDLWTLNWMFTPENENKSPEAWKQVTATSFKVLEDWLKTNSPKSIHISGNTNTKTKLYKTYVNKLETLLNNKYIIDNSDVDKVVLRSIEETSQLSIKKRMESLNESYKQSLNYYQNGNLNSKSRIEQWNSIKKLIERETLKEVYGLVKNLLPQEKFAQETGQDYIQQALNNIPQRDKYDTKNYKVVTLSLDKVKPTQFGEDYINPSSEYEAEQYKKYLEGKIEVEDLRKEDFYPIIVDKNTMEVIDGNHRHAVHTILNIPKIKAILISKKIQNENKKKDLFGLNEYIQELASLDKDKIKVYLDMDGVLADFDKRFRDLAGMLPSEFESKYGKNAFWDFIDEGNNKVKFWVGIPVMDGAKQLIDWASQYKYSLLTAPSNKKQSLIGKSLWVKKHTGDLFPTTPFINFKRAKNKHLVKPDLQPTDILIDDREDTIERWNAAGGTGIHYRNISQVLNDLAKLGL